MAHNKTTGKSAASVASKTMRTNTSPVARSAAANALSQTKGKKP